MNSRICLFFSILYNTNLSIYADTREKYTIRCDWISGILDYLCSVLSFIQHIEHLLLGSNCVIIPELGSFITHYIPAKCITGEDIILPPTRIIAFNPQLRINDGSLAGSIMKTFGSSLEEADRYVGSCVWTIRRQLLESGSFKLGSIGTLYLDASGLCKFVSSDTAMPAPELFGLESVRAMGTHRVISEKYGSAMPLRLSENKDRYIISVNRDIVNYIAAALVALVCLFAWQRDYTTDHRMINSASILPIEAINNLGGADISSQFLKNTQPNYIFSKSESVNLTEHENVPKDSFTDEGDYTIVLVSSVTKKNAEKFVGELSAAGITGAEITLQGKGLAQVICGHYETASAAQAAADSMRSSPLASDCWVKNVSAKQ